MIPVTIPLIENVGLSILQAKNKYKFMTMTSFAIALVNVLISIPLAKHYQGMGTAIGTSISIIIGQVIILNVYYHKKVNLNMFKFWKEISKMLVMVILSLILGLSMYNVIKTKNIIIYGIEIIVYTLIYSFLMWKFAMNNYEKDSIKKPINVIRKKMTK